jgi:hypothetical protein
LWHVLGPQLPGGMPLNLADVWGRTGTTVLAWGLGIAAVIGLLRWQVRVARVAAGALLICFPFTLLVLARATWALVTYDALNAGLMDKPLAPPVAVHRTAHARVLWLLFDELDQRLTFADRPASVQLPEFDRLRGEALYAANAYPPSGWTLWSMPALIGGELVSEAKAASADELLITYAQSGATVPWSTQPNVFTQAREAGFNAAIVGWYHPYCRMFAASVTRCSWQPWGVGTEVNLVSRATRLLDVPVVWRIRKLLRINEWVLRARQTFRVDRYRSMMDDAKAATVDPAVDLAFVHLPVPHPPGVFKRSTGEFTVDRDASYLDSLELADHALGELRGLLERRGLWANTTVIVSSDHGYRTFLWKGTLPEEATAADRHADYRVPFLVKLAGQNDGVAYDDQLSTVVTRDLVLALLRGDVSTRSELVAWLDRHRATEAELARELPLIRAGVESPKKSSQW